MQRLVQTHLGGHARYGLGVCMFAHHGLDRIAGDDPQHHEDQQGHPDQDDKRLNQPAHQVVFHHGLFQDNIRRVEIRETRPLRGKGCHPVAQAPQVQVREHRNQGRVFFDQFFVKRLVFLFTFRVVHN